LLIAYIDRVAGTGELEVNSLVQSLIQGKVNLRDLGSLKAGLFTADSVDADGENRDAVATVAAGAHSANGAGCVQRGGDNCLGNGGSRRVQDDPFNGGLCEGSERQEHHDSESTHG